MEDKRYVQFKCYIHELPLDGTWHCPDKGCRAAHCPLCGRCEKDRCEHLLYTQGEWVYYAPDGLNSEDFPGGGFEEYRDETVEEAFREEPELATRLSWGWDPLRILCELAVERIEGPTVVSSAGGWRPGGDSWSNTWVQDMPEALGKLRPLVECYLAGVTYLDALDPDGGFDLEDEYLTTAYGS